MKTMPTLVACLAGAIIASAQSPRTFPVRGDIENYPAGDVLFVELRPVTTAAAIRRELAGHDGSFEFRDIEAGTYEAIAMTSQGAALRREIVHLDAFSNRFTIHLPKVHSGGGPGGAISMKRLAFRPSKEARKLFRKAQSEGQRKRTAEAISLLARAVEIEPEWAEAHNNLGVQYYRLADLGHAFASFERARAIDPDSSEIASNYAIALIPMGRARDAESEIRRVMARNGESPKSRFVLGMALAAQGIRKEEARELLTGVADQFPGAKAFLNRLRE